MRLEDVLRRVLRQPLRLVLSVVLIIWAGFWSTFVLAVVMGEPLGGWGRWRPAVQFLAVLLPPVVVAMIRPRAGGVLLLGAGLFAGWFFSNGFARATLAAPAIAVGSVLLLVRSRPAGSTSPPRDKPDPTA